MHPLSLLLPLLLSPLTLSSPLPHNNLPRQTTATNLQTFTGTLGAAADPITNSGDATRPFEVNGNTFVNFAAAAQRTCDIQFNACANAANGGADFSPALTSFSFPPFKAACDAAQTNASVKNFDPEAASATAAAATPAVAAGTTCG
ncbi:hypothetical protein MMC20_002136 [Loxospora ochrophaea]|nr:hypothetical protein [Loxospora ochrophaea]